MYNTNVFRTMMNFKFRLRRQGHQRNTRRSPKTLTPRHAVEDKKHTQWILTCTQFDRPPWASLCRVGVGFWETSWPIKRAYTQSLKNSLTDDPMKRFSCICFTITTLPAAKADYTTRVNAWIIHWNIVVLLVHTAFDMSQAFHFMASNQKLFV